MKHENSGLKGLLCLALVLLSVPRVAPAQETEEAFKLPTADGFLLDGKLRLPPGSTPDQVNRVIILLHGSGPQSMDADFTAITKQGKQNLFFAEISDALSSAGFAVLRYNKRSYQANLEIQHNASYRTSDQYQAYAADPLDYFVTDAVDAVRYAESAFPEADIYLFGHSQGTFIALQVAQQMPQVRGVALVGYAVSSTETLLFEQTVYRPLSFFVGLDENGDGLLDQDELASEDPIAATLRNQLPVLDLDFDGKVALMEFQAGNLSNLLVRDILLGLREQEARYPRTPEILASASFKVSFFQGLLDNQTPAYNTKAVELVVNNVWSKDNFQFTYFPNLGHALDPRDSFDDLGYDVIDPEAKEALVSQLSIFFREGN